MRHNRVNTIISVILMSVLFGGLVPTNADDHKNLLRLRIDGPLLEAPNDAAGLMALFENQELYSLHQLVRSIRQAGADRQIDGLALIIEQPLMSLAQAEELSAAIDAFQAHDKPVYCYLDYADNLSYALAATADHITLAEHSELAITGLHASVSFYKGLLDKIGVEADMLHCGDYKSALEPYTRTEPSPEAAENINWLLDSLYERWVQMIADGRALSAAEVKKLIDQAPLDSQLAREHKLVDEVSSFPAFKQRMYKEFGIDVTVHERYSPDAPAGMDINPQDPFALFQIMMQAFEQASIPTPAGIGLIYVDGAIMTGVSDDSPFGGSYAGSSTVRAALEEARADDDIKAVVLRVNSPGGSALASDIIWKAGELLAKEKPLIVSMGGVAGSGGYYVSLPGDTVFADATTITGSIGVVGGKLVWKELMEDKLGITTAEFKRGAHAGMMSPNQQWTESERDWIEGYMEDVYEQFKGRVRESRGPKLERELEEIAGGRVYTGEQALELGLIDEIGGLHEALEHAARKAGMGSDYHVRVLPAPSDLVTFVNAMTTMFEEDQADEFEIALVNRLRSDVALSTALPAAEQMMPGRAGMMLRDLYYLVMLQRERAGCFMPGLPLVR